VYIAQSEKTVFQHNSNGLKFLLKYIMRTQLYPLLFTQKKPGYRSFRDNLAYMDHQGNPAVFFKTRGFPSSPHGEFGFDHKNRITVQMTNGNHFVWIPILERKNHFIAAIFSKEILNWS
jgi:hypothetical protein